MAFDYQTLKNLRSDAIIDGAIATGDLADSSINAGQIANNNVTAGKLATGAIDNAGTVTTGTLPVAKGGVTLTTFAGANRAIYSDGSTLSFQNHGIQGLSVFTSTGTWSRPAGVRYIRVQVQAGAGGGSGHGEGGGAGGYSEKFIDVTGIASVGVTIGGGGSGTYYANAGDNGAASSFGPYCSASAGHGANRQNQHSGGVSGVGSGGNLNLHMGGGLSHHAYSAQSCADTYFGGGAVSSHPQGGHFAHNHQGHSAPGSGGAGAHYHGHRGSDGRPGIIIVTNYY
jgi:hypothetical protein